MVLKVLELVLGFFMVFKVCVCRFFLPQARRSGRLSDSSQRTKSKTGAPRSKPEEKKRLQSVAEEPSNKKKRVSKK